MSSTGRGFGQSGEQNFDGGRPSKFLYSGKNKKIDPWGTSDTDHENGIEHSLQPKNKLLKTKDTRSSPGCELDDVWSIRKNVQVTQASKKGTVLNTNKSTPSYYSRHGGLSGTGDVNSSILNKGNNDDFLGSSADHKSWSIARGNFSYSDKPKFSPGGTHGTSTASQPDDFLDTSRNSDIPATDEFDMVQRKNLLNSKLRMAGAPQIATREMSARTRRAKKMHDAHLRSMGLAQYTPGNGSYISPGKEQENNNWKQNDDDDDDFFS